MSFSLRTSAIPRTTEIHASGNSSGIALSAKSISRHASPWFLSDLALRKRSVKSMFEIHKSHERCGGIELVAFEHTTSLMPKNAAKQCMDMETQSEM